MTRRAIAAITTVILFFGGCSTTTAHRLALTESPSRTATLDCEARCRQASTESGNVNLDRYAACIDGCPGARTTSASCPPPDPNAICVETTSVSWTWTLVVIGAVIALLLLVISAGRALQFG